MSHFTILGGERLSGTVRAGGSKNAALPMMAVSILADEPVRLEGVPWVDDVETLTLVLGDLGVEALRTPDGAVTLETVDPTPIRAGYELVRRMRASFCVLGPLLARRGKAIVSLPGGCNIGPRPVDLHLRGLAALGAELRIECGYVIARANRLVGADVSLVGPHGPTVTGTANVLSAAVLAEGETTIRGAAVEPEIVDLGTLLNRMGARIAGLGTPTLHVTGVKQLGGAAHRIIPDRIEAATLLLAAAITGGSATVTGVVPDHLGQVLVALRATGSQVEAEADRLTIRSSERPEPVEVTALPYPGIPTDLQAQFMALVALARGRSTIRDRVFPGRLMHVAELNRLGARIEVSKGAAIVEGVAGFSGAGVMASDLRASAALVLAGLAAEGETVVDRIEHLDRGSERLEAKLKRLGARIERSVSPEESESPSTP